MDNNAYNKAGQPILTKVVSSKKSFMLKSATGVAILIMDIILIGVAAGSLSAPGVYTWYYYFSPFYNFVFCVPTAILSFGWQVAEFITVAVRKDRGIHPGAHVGMHLVIWLSYIVAAVYSGFEVQRLDHYNRYPYDGYRSSRTAASDIQAGIKKIFSFQVAVLVFVVLLVLAHFALFVRACIETHRRNKQIRGVYVQAKQTDQQWGGNQA
ncbi:hypothetical protein PpBr36_09041 [Pyricularia pennisetigena]|uniref:hypothetical protein n=1 Tax=Pyricularia pennisetigena TaxID=1578925 RepID=UPI00115160C6|nr:hypothetical protein PpBr36_09041 [Pyricularia pennisetigena]TLS24378.1 hypothetical protein PpBr36_09041 [Pyricularia pennisetigena]